MVQRKVYGYMLENNLAYTAHFDESRYAAHKFLFDETAESSPLPPHSVLNYFFPLKSENSSLNFNGQGNQVANIREVVNWLADTTRTNTPGAKTGHFDKTFMDTYEKSGGSTAQAWPRSASVKAHFIFGYPRHGAPRGQCYRQSLHMNWYRNHLAAIFDKLPEWNKSTKIRVLYQAEGSSVYEFKAALFSDLVNVVFR